MFAFRRILACAALLAAAVAPAQADIRSFNAAVQKGDYRAAVVAANETWPLLDHAGPDAVSVAREFGWVAMLAGQPNVALVYANFLVEQGAALARPDAAPAVSRVLRDWANLSVTPTQQARLQLLASLQQRGAASGRDLISARAAHALHAQAIAAGDWVQAYDSALLAIRFLDELGARSPPSRYELRRGVAISSFMRVKSPEAYNALYDVAAELADQVIATPPGAGRDRLAGEYFTSVAWGDVMYGALPAAIRKTTPDRRNSVRQLAEVLYPAPGDTALPRCRISLAREFNNPGFTFDPRFRDLGGEVIYALDVMPDGTFSNARPLVSAPHNGFANAMTGLVPGWRWRVDPGQPTCRTPSTHILTFEFALGR
ncbi:MAG: hypothetical protein EOP61_11890 [Sphingomonadales bacterium]|nr:MAG: hypothetical protein EOP61_11890 [Sphingomonadales bacterium]